MNLIVIQKGPVLLPLTILLNYKIIISVVWQNVSFQFDLYRKTYYILHLHISHKEYIFIRTLKLFHEHILSV